MEYNGEVKEYYIPCDCHAHLVQVTHWVDDDDTFLTWWENGKGNSMPLFQRLTAMWKILVRGRYADYELCLSEDSREELIKALKNDDID